jgi:peptidoglycan/LPS O-acetylase OafA/YrhL
VDLFFCLSGFVLAHAYSNRLDAGMSFVDFMRKRLLRLWPLYALGMFVAAVPVVLGVLHHRRGASALGPLVAGLFYIPWPGPGGALYPLNIPAWSLLFELVANALMELAWRWLNNFALAAIVGGGAIAIVGAAFAFGSLDGGFSLATAPIGLARVAFSFFLGILLWRARPQSSTLSAWVQLIAVGLVLAVSAGPVPRGVVDVLAVVLVLPTIVWMGARTEPRGMSLTAFSVAGAMSYAIYVLHVPLMMPIAWIVQKRLQTTAAAIPVWVGLAVLAGLALLSWVLNLADVRLRKWIQVGGAA